MMEALAKRGAAWLIKMGAIPEEERELYQYAVYSVLFGTLPILIALAWGVVLHMMPQALLLMLPFVLIRKFSGGYHLSSPTVCAVSSTLLIGGALGVVKLFSMFRWKYLLMALVLLAVVCLFCMSPIDSENRRLSKKEEEKFRQIARTLSLLSLAVFLLFWAFDIESVAVPLGIGILLPALLQLPVLLQRKAR